MPVGILEPTVLTLFVVDVAAHLPVGVVESLEDAARTATGPVGLAIIFVYSVLIAVILPMPSEVVLATPLRLGLPRAVDFGLIILVSSIGKALGSLLAFRLGHGVTRSGPFIRLLRRSRFDFVEWSERRVVQLAKTYGYAGMAVALSVPGFPDTISIYAFSVLEENYALFALAAFAGSVGRLLITLLFVGGAIRLF